MKPTLIWLFLALCFSTCMDPPVDSKLTLVNSSVRPIVVYYNVDRHIPNGMNGLSDHNPFLEIQRADTTRGYQSYRLAYDSKYVAPGDSVSAHLGMGTWEGHIGTGKLWIYVFAPETILKYNWASIRMSKRWTNVYSFTLAQVQDKEWTIRL